MSDQFKALILNQDGESFTREVKSVEKNFLKHGDVTVKVEYSGLNYKDALILKNGARLVKEFPHIPGIDFSGVIEESNHKDLRQYLKRKLYQSRLKSMILFVYYVFFRRGFLDGTRGLLYIYLKLSYERNITLIKCYEELH